MAEDQPNVETKVKKKGEHDKPKPWDDGLNIDRWKIEPFTEPDGYARDKCSTLLPQYRNKYLHKAWPTFEAALKEFGIACKTQPGT